VHESVSWSNGGRLFHTKGLAAEKAQSPSLICVRTVVAVMVVADWRWLLFESMLAKCTISQRYVGQSWCSIKCLRICL